MNVRFIISSPERPSARVRVVNLLSELQKHGVRGEAVTFPRGLRDRFRMLRGCRDCNVVVLHKRMLLPPHLLVLRHAAPVLVFDFDDAVFLRDVWPPDPNANWRSLSRSLKFRMVTTHSDMVLAGNEYLLAEARKHQPRSHVLPSAVPVSGVPQRSARGENPVPVVGWVGTEGSLLYVERIAGILQRVASEHPFELRIISNVEFSIPGVDCRNIRWQKETQEAEIAEFDVGLMPLSDDPWARGKCAYKLLQYMAGGVPFVASAVGMNVEVAAGDTAGFAASDDEDFGEKLLVLLREPERRLGMGATARQLAEDRYSIEAVAASLAGRLREAVEIR